MNLKVPGAILPLGCAILSTRAKTVRGVGTTPLGELGLKLNPKKNILYNLLCTCCNYTNNKKITKI